MNELIENINKINSTSVEDLTTNINQKATGTLEFPSVKSQVANIKQILSFFDEDTFNLLPIFQKTYFKEITSPLINKVLEMQNVALDGSRPIDQQQRHFNEYFNTMYIKEPERAPEDQGYAKYIGKIWSIILESLVLKQRSELQESGIDELRSTLKQKQDTVDAVEKEFQKASQKISKESLIIQKESGKIGVGTHANIFSDEAIKNEKASKRWLKYGVRLLITVGAVILLVAVIYFFWNCWFNDEMDTIDRIELGIFTALIISFLSYGIYVCFKNYFAEKHNEKINTHKANCLSTYFTFIESADEETRQTILKITTQSIYSHQPTGYSGKGSSTVSNPNPFIEIFKNAASGVTNAGS